jgi:hypothetical protein
MQVHAKSVKPMIPEPGWLGWRKSDLIHVRTEKRDLRHVNVSVAAWIGANPYLISAVSATQNGAHEVSLFVAKAMVLTFFSGLGFFQLAT